LGDRLGSVKIDAVWSSDLCRASATGAILAAPHGLTVRISPLLRESMLGNWEGKTEAEICAGGEEEQWIAYRRDAIAVRPPGAEPLQLVWDRMLKALQEIRDAHPSGTIVIVGHGGSLRVILCEA